MPCKTPKHSKGKEVKCLTNTDKIIEKIIRIRNTHHNRGKYNVTYLIFVGREGNIHDDTAYV